MEISVPFRSMEMLISLSALICDFPCQFFFFPSGILNECVVSSVESYTKSLLCFRITTWVQLHKLSHHVKTVS